MRTEDKWNMKNALRMLLYAVLYVVMSFIVCVLGSVNPIFFVCYQITAGLLVTGVAAKAFDRIRQSTERQQSKQKIRHDQHGNILPEIAAVLFHNSKSSVYHT